MRRVNDELKEISVLQLNPLITWVTLWEQKTLMLSSFSSRRLILLYILYIFLIQIHFLIPTMLGHKIKKPSTCCQC